MDEVLACTDALGLQTDFEWQELMLTWYCDSYLSQPLMEEGSPGGNTQQLLALAYT